MPAGGFWRISPESLEKAIEWQKQYGGKVKWNDPVVYGRDWYYDGKINMDIDSMMRLKLWSGTGLRP